MQLAMSGTCLAVGQGVWISFLVTILVNQMGMSLTMAGFYFSLMQASGVFGRIFLGWISDRLGSGRLTLRLAIMASAATTLCLPFLSPDWSVLSLSLLCAVAGLTVTSWNGVQIAEIAQLAPPEKVQEASSGATLVLFVGYVAGPAGFAALASLTGSMMVGLYVTVLVIASGLLILPARRPQQA
jgi:predicted MFS family arabinose efflux permease